MRRYTLPSASPRTRRPPSVFDVANGFAQPVTTQVELRYTQVTGSVEGQTVMTKDVTLAGLRHQAGVLRGNQAHGRLGRRQRDGEPRQFADRDRYVRTTRLALSSRNIYETKKLDGLFVPVVVPGDFGPSLSQFDSTRASWSRYLAETYPIDDGALARTRQTGPRRGNRTCRATRRATG